MKSWKDQRVSWVIWIMVLCFDHHTLFMTLLFQFEKHSWLEESSSWIMVFSQINENHFAVTPCFCSMLAVVGFRSNTRIHIMKESLIWSITSETNDISTAGSVSRSAGETTCFCLCAVKTLSSGWGTPCWTFQLLWTKISLTSKSKQLLCCRGWFLAEIMSPENTLFFSPSRFGLKPNDQILAEDKHKALWVWTFTVGRHMFQQRRAKCWDYVPPN